MHAMLYMYVYVRQIEVNNISTRAVADRIITSTMNTYSLHWLYMLDIHTHVRGRR